MFNCLRILMRSNGALHNLLAAPAAAPATMFCHFSVLLLDDSSFVLLLLLLLLLFLLLL